MRNQRRSTFAGPGQSPRILWQSEIIANDDIAASLAADGTIYAGGFGGLVMLRPDGSEISRISASEGIHASLAETGLVYLTDDFSDLVDQLDPMTLQRSHLFNFWASGGVSLSPTVGADQQIYAGGIYGQALTTSGEPLWSVAPSGDVNSGARCEHVPAIAPDGTLRFACNSVLRAVDHQGKTLWTAPAMAGLDSSAAVDDHGNTYLCASGLLAIDSAGVERFTSGSCASGTSPAIGEDGAIYFASIDGLVALNNDGSERFHVPYYRNESSSPAVDSEGTIYIAAEIAMDSGEYLIAINANGTEKWKLAIGSEAGSPSIGLDHRIYVAAFDTGRVRRLVAVGP